METIELKGGVYPTMITPYKDNKIDFDRVDALVEWYIKSGCAGIFAVCQSSEMAFLSLDERVSLARAVVKAANGRIKIVASGHVADSLEEQLRETEAIAATGVDSVVLVSNRFDLHNDGDDVWIKNAEKFLNYVDKNIQFGIYECPKPYKRLISLKLFKWILKSERFLFVKDTCCDPETIAERGDLLKNSKIKLFNANGQTLLYSMIKGYAGYSGFIANYVPELLVWLCNNYDKDKDKAEIISEIISMMSFTVGPAYPSTAKYYINKNIMPMEIFSRSCDEKKVDAYQRHVADQIHSLATRVKRIID